MIKKPAYYIVNGITIYRLAVAPILLLLVLTRQFDTFKWLLPLSFFTDAIDGYLARKYQVVSQFGSRMDSIADDCTVAVGIVGLFVFKTEFFYQILPVGILLFSLYLVQVVLAFIRYRRMSYFHTYTAKLAAFLQGVFLILIFFVPGLPSFLFYAAAFVTAIDLIEETILVLLLPAWRTNVKGVYWVLKKKRNINS